MALAIFPGSFDPMTNGHLDIINRALKMFDRVMVAVLMNSAKKNPLFTIEERLALLRACIPSDRVTIASFEGLLVDFAQSQDAKVLVRGLRAVSDFEYELQMAHMNRQLAPDIETVFLMPKTDYSYLSSRMVKEVARLGGNITSLVPPLIESSLRKKFNGEAIDLPEV